MRLYVTCAVIRSRLLLLGNTPPLPRHPAPPPRLTVTVRT